MEHLAVLLPELVDAFKAGFTSHFIIRPDGMCLSCCTGKLHEIYEAKFVCLSMIPGTLFLVTLSDGTQGTAIDYWDIH